MDSEDSQNPEYIVESTSSDSAIVQDVELGRSPNGQTRKVLRAEIVQNQRNSDNPVKITLLHQRRSQSVDWQDIDGVPLSRIRAGDASKMSLNTEETRVLNNHLANLFEIGHGGVRRGARVVTVANENSVIASDASRARLLRKIAESENLEELADVNAEFPEGGVAQAFAVAKLHQSRRAVLDEFSARLESSLDENNWKAFLRQHSWVFGVSNIEVLDESRMGIHHDTDIPFGVEGGFMDIAELKKPDEKFWRLNSDGTIFLYRGKFPVESFEVTAAVSQVNGYILEAEKNVNNADFIRDHGGRVPLKPRGLVVAGRSIEWSEKEWQAYRLLNDRLHGTQVITYDILLERAKRALSSLTS